jgi:prephenate dehydrogenase
VGTVKKVTSKIVMIDEDNKEITLKLSNVDILSEEEVFEWKKNNLKLEYFNLSVMLPSKCDEKYLIKMFKNIGPVIDVEIIDINNDGEIDVSLTLYTFHYSVFDKKDKARVEEYIEGVGGNIRG